MPIPQPSIARHLRLALAFLFAVGLFAGAAQAQGIKTKRNYIRVDQFGYVPTAPKVAVIADAVDGFNAAYGIDLDAGVEVTLRSANGAVVKRAKARAWNGGATDGYSGDRGWWFDFSEVTAAGEYYVQVTERSGNTVNSNRFRIGDDVYAGVLKRAMQMFYYQRANQNKTAAYAAGADWTDGPWYAGGNQDVSAYFLNDNSQRKDVRGGWIDAGDPNKYVTFAAPPVHNLLSTYEQHPDLWNSFSLDIPESSNSAPDILDEVKFEIDWVRRMQAPNGGLHLKAGILNDYRFTYPPSTDSRNRYYEEICPSASITGAGMMAHAAIAYRTAGVFSGDVSDLTTRAERAWDHYSNSPYKAAECDGGEIEAGDADGVYDGHFGGPNYAAGHVAEATVAAVYLYALTGKTKYDDFVKANYTQLRPWHGDTNEWSIYRSNHGEAALYYARLPNADASVRDAIIAKKTSSAKSSGAYYSVRESDNLYRAKALFLNWGSNSLMSREGYHNYDFVNYGLNEGSHADYRARSSAIVNYMHGVNPFGMVYLTNMYGDGAELSADEVYHTWFYHGTKYDNIGGGKVGPPPGILQGGANPSGGYLTMKIGTDEFNGVGTNGQPRQKAFSVSNEGRAKAGGGYEAPYAFNEPAIYYQASYVKMLANFVAAGSTPPPPPVEEADALIAIDAPARVTPGVAVDVTIAYSAKRDRDVFVYLEDNGAPWTRYASARRRVTAGSGSVTLKVNVPKDLELGAKRYKWQSIVTESGADWGKRKGNEAIVDVDAVAAPATTTRSEVIYADALGSGWSDYSWGGKATPRDGGVWKVGSASFKYLLGEGGGAVSFSHASGKTGAKLKRLEFYARTWDKDVTFEVSGSYDDAYENRSAGKSIAVTPTWRKYTVTAAELNAYGWYKRLFFAAGRSNATLFLDQVGFVYEEAALDSRDVGEVVAASVRVVPNPNDGAFALRIDRGRDGDGSLAVEVLDATGRSVFAQAYPVTDQEPVLRVDLRPRGLPRGMYTVVVRGDGGGVVETARVSVQ